MKNEITAEDVALFIRQTTFGRYGTIPSEETPTEGEKCAVHRGDFVIADLLQRLGKPVKKELDPIEIASLPAGGSQ